MAHSRSFMLVYRTRSGRSLSWLLSSASVLSVSCPPKNTSPSMGNSTRASQPGKRPLVRPPAWLLLSAHTVTLYRAAPSSTSTETFIMRLQLHDGASLSARPPERGKWHRGKRPFGGRSRLRDSTERAGG